MTTRRNILTQAASLALLGCTPRAGVTASAEPGPLTGTAREQAELTRLYEQALSAGEREVTILSTTYYSEWESLWRGFEAAFPALRLIYSHVSPNQVTVRVDSESVSGRRFCDVFVLPVHIAPTIAARGYFQSFRPATTDRLDRQYVDAEDFLHYPLGKVFGLAYSTETVAPEALPKVFEDVLAPQWRQSFTYIKPDGLNGTTDVALAVLKANGRVTRDQLERLRQNGAFGAYEAGVTYVSQGRQKLNLWAYLPTVLRQSRLGAPVDIRFVPDFSAVVPFAATISRNSPHPLAARLLKSWLFTPDAQAILARKVGMFGFMPGTPVPPRFPDTPEAQARLHPNPPIPELIEILDSQADDLRTIFNAPLAPRQGA